jgi:hypothetical protein
MDTQGAEHAARLSATNAKAYIMLSKRRQITPDRETLQAAVSRLQLLSSRHCAGIAVLTLALSLPQGLLALPIAIAQVGLGFGLLIMLVVGLLNTVTTAWIAHATATHFVRHRIVLSLPQLARAHLGRWGELLALAGGVALFFLALLASVFGLARSLADLTGVPAPLWGVGNALVIVLLLQRRAALSTCLLSGLGLLNASLLVAVLVLTLPHTSLAPAPAVSGDSSPLLIVGVAQMLFFAPMLVAPLAQQVLPHVRDRLVFVRGSAVGVASSTLVFVVWATVICGTADPAALAELTGTAIPALLVVAPEAWLPALLLGLMLLGMTTLRCAIVLKMLASEQLPARLGRFQRHLIEHLPAGLGLAAALSLVLSGATSFTQLIAVAGVGSASLISLLVPALLACAEHNRSLLASAILDRLLRISTTINIGGQNYRLWETRRAEVFHGLPAVGKETTDTLPEPHSQ